MSSRLVIESVSFGKAYRLTDTNRVCGQTLIYKGFIHE
jgi:hypothetical protein